MAEQLALQQSSRHRGAIDRHERTVFASAGIVNALSDQLFTGTAFPLQYDIGVRQRGPFSQCHAGAKRLAAIYQVVKGILGAQNPFHRALQVQQRVLCLAEFFRHFLCFGDIPDDRNAADDFTSHDNRRHIDDVFDLTVGPVDAVHRLPGLDHAGQHGAGPNFGQFAEQDFFDLAADDPQVLLVDVLDDPFDVGDQQPLIQRIKDVDRPFCQ